MIRLLALFCALSVALAALSQQSGDKLLEKATELIFFDEDYAAAVPVLEQCVQAFTAEFGADHYKTVGARYELACACAHTGRRSEAVRHYAAVSAATTLSPVDAYLDAITILEEDGDLNRADSLYAAAHAWHKTAPAWHDDMRKIYVRQYNRAIDALHIDEAMRIAAMQLELIDSLPHPNTRTRERILSELSEIASYMGNTPVLMKYGPQLATAYESIPEALRATDPQGMALCVPVAMYYGMSGRTAQAEAVWRTALRMPRPADTMNAVLTGYATFLGNNGRATDAYALYTRAAANYAAAEDCASAARAALSAATLARSVKDWERLRDATDMAGGFVEQLLKSGAYSPGEAAEINSNFAGLCFDAGRYERAERIYEMVLDYYSSHDMRLAQAQTLVNLGACRANAGCHDEALGLYGRAAACVDMALHPDLQLSVASNAARSLALSGKTAEAVTAYGNAMQRLREVMATGFVYMTEPERQEFWDSQNYIFDNIHNLGSDPAAAVLRFDAALVNKGILLDSSLRLRALIEHSGDDALRTDFGRLADLLHRNPHSEEATAMIRDLQQRAAEFGDYTAGADMRTSDICRSLQPDECAVEIVRRVGADGLYAYDALIADANGSVAVAALPSQAEIEAARGIYTDPAALADAFWQPILARAKDKKTIYVSPDGAYHAIAFEYLPQEGEPMVQRRSIVRLSSTRQLPVLQRVLAPASIALWGGLDYNSDIEDDESGTLDRSRGLRLETGAASWSYLPGTQREVSEVQALAEGNIRCDIYTAEDGVEEAFKDISGRSPDVLHMATHGFFIPQSHVQPGAEMLNSGLILAGANNNWVDGGIVHDNCNDGILTSSEIARLDLSGAGLVVLSACQSGLGDISPEGVFGLPRAFKKSGAGTIVMTLWSVDDTATQHIMTAFYRRMLAGSAPRPALVAAFGDTGYTDPALWAAFVVMD